MNGTPQETPPRSGQSASTTSTAAGGEARPKVVLVTGAAGGLGQALVGEFVAHGWQVGAGYHRAPLPRRSESLLAVRMDVSSAEEVTLAVESLLARWDRIDVLVNNAGTLADRPVWELTETEWDRVLAVNLKGAALAAQAVLRPMLKQREGHIINIASFSGKVGARGQANYAAAKAGLIGLTQSLARETGPYNVRVNAILPGLLPTAMIRGLSPKARAAVAAANALGHGNTLAEVARFVCFLATLENVSGQIFQLDSRIAPWT